MSDKEERKTITRAELYELVWSQPMTEVAKQLGTSAPEITRLCDQVFRIPRPQRGHWQRSASGKMTPKPDLPPAEKNTPDTVKIQFYQTDISTGELLRQALVAGGRDIPVAPVDRTFSHPHSQIAAARAGRGGASDLSPTDVRCYAVADAFIKTMEMRGHRLEDKADGPGGCSFWVFGQEVGYRFHELTRTRHEPLSATERNLPLNRQYGITHTEVVVPTGQLRFEAQGRNIRLFKRDEGPGKLFDAHLAMLVLSMEVVAQKAKEVKERAEERERRWNAEIEAKKDIRQQEWFDEARWRRLRDMARKRHKAKRIRAFLKDLAEACEADEQLAPDVEELTVWADDYLWGLDPLSEGPKRALDRLNAPVRRPDFMDIDDLFD
jgi:hypothetical protein